MKTFKNKNFKKRDYECTNIVFCQSKEKPELTKTNSIEWIECDESEIEKMRCNQLWCKTINGVNVRFFGYL